MLRYIISLIFFYNHKNNHKAISLSSSVVLIRIHILICVVSFDSNRNVTRHRPTFTLGSILRSVISLRCEDIITALFFGRSIRSGGNRSVRVPRLGDHGNRSVQTSEQRVGKKNNVQEKTPSVIWNIIK
jgi:hypothetical protein